MSADPSLTRPTAEVLKVEDLLDAVRRGEVRVPRFQRPLKWRAGHVKALFDSILRGYPVGTLLFWRRAAEAEELRFGPVRVVAGPLQRARWVVDGQQRITSLAGVLLRADDVGDDPFALWWDFERGELRSREDARAPDPGWLPLRVLGDLERLLPWMQAEPSEERRRTAHRLAKAIREYQIPTYTVETDDERIAREVFDRMNTSGAAMGAEDVFNALHGGTGPEPGDLRDVAARLARHGFGAWDERWLLKSVAAVAGKDLSRGLDELVRTHRDLGDALPRAERSLARVIHFLREDAGIPHLRLLPYRLPLLVLARFFDRFPEPAPRTRVLLSRWLWRGAVSGVHGNNSAPVLRDTVDAVDGDEHTAIMALLGTLGGWDRLSMIDLLQMVGEVRKMPWDARSAHTRIATQAYLYLRPRDILTGTELDVTSVMEEYGPLAFPVIDPASTDTLSTRMLHRPLQDLLAHLLRADALTLASHGFPSESPPFSDASRAVRKANLRNALSRSLEARLGLGDTDRPALGALRVADDDE